VADGLSDNDVASLFEDSRGDLWMGHFAPGEYVLTRFARSSSSFHRYSSRDGLRAASQPSAFAEGPSGDLWIGFRDGEVVRHHAGRFIQELPPDPQPERRVSGIYPDDEGAVWISRVGIGLMRIDTGATGAARTRPYTVADGLASNNVGVLTQGADGAIYVEVGHTFGIDRLDPRTGAVRHFTSSDGLPNADYLSAHRDRAGALWFGTSAGLIRFTPAPDPPVLSPDIRIGSLQISGGLVPVHPLGAPALGPFRLAPGSNRVAISFFGLSPALDEGLRYQYRLEGADDEWSAPTQQRAVDYANLAPGRYRFAVHALGKEGTASASPATVTFTILPPVWRRWWFLASVVLVAGLAARFLHQYQLRRAIELERVRMRIATDLHDDIGAGLSQVAVLSAVVSRRTGTDPAIAEPLTAIGELARDLVDSMSDIVWAINPRRDHAFDLTHRMRRFASDVLGAKDIDLAFTADADDEDVGLGPEIRREVWLIFKESVNNIARHSGCTHAEITVRIAQQRLQLTVSDNGRGFSPNQESEGHGMPSIRQRAARIGAALEVHSKPGQGTRVNVNLPIGGR
jgi:signal transduction histidine kinase